MMLFRVTVTGESMWPILVPGQTYWASSLLPIRVGSIVVAKMPHRTIVKLVDTVDEDTIRLIGTRNRSTPITVNQSAILGRLLRRGTTAGTKSR